MLYFDNNATTPLAPEVREAMLPFLGGNAGNPSSAHTAGRAARRAVENARAQMAALLGAIPDALIFTSGGTESINTAVRGALVAQPQKRHIVTSAIEHSATKNLCEYLEREGYEITWLGVDENGLPSMDEFVSSLRGDTALATLLWANNETGVIFPMEEMARTAHERRIIFHVDAVQAVGKLSINLANTPIHLLSVSAHKFHGPMGVGALFVRQGLGLPPLILGGGQEHGRRGGTENVSGIIGMGQAAELARAALTGDMPRVVEMRDALEADVRRLVPQARFHGDPQHRLPNTTNFALPGLDARALLVVLDRLGVACSIGSACSSGSPDASHVLRAMGVPEDEAKSSLRFSLSRMNHPEEIPAVIQALTQALERMEKGKGSMS